jgi:predicted O-linked N-acetylglucosamine transferase (SPINDLY family)/glycosyltransferase involved in cell wall biosynthesis
MENGLNGTLGVLITMTMKWHTTSVPTIAPVPKGVYRPFWSVMIPTYNCADSLSETLKSVLEQAPAPEQMQIEVVDDYSIEDDPEAVVKEIGKGRVSFFRQPQNVGAMLNFNACIQRANGQWVHILHGDDTVLPGFYSRFREAIEKEPTVRAVFCRHIYMDEKSHWSFLSQLERETPGILSDCLERLVIFNRIMTPSIVVKRSVYEELGGFNLELFHSGDWDMWKRIATTYPVWYDSQPLACYRQHSNSDTSRLMITGANIADGCKSIAISESYLPKTIATELSNQAREHHASYAFNTAYRLFTRGDTVAALAQIREGIKCSHSPKAIQSMLELLQELANNFNQFELIPINALDQFLTEFQFVAQLNSWADEYRKDPNNQSALINLQQARRVTVQKCLTLSPIELESMYLGEFGKVHQILLDSGVKNEPSIDDTKIFADECKEFEDSNAINYLLAAMLYYYADQMSLPYDLTNVPHWLLNVYLKFIFQSPPLVQEVGEVEKYYQYMQQWLDYIHTCVFSNPDSRVWQDVAVFFAKSANFIPLYFSQANLIDIYTKRAEIIEFGLKLFDHQIDYVFLERATNRNKIRLGILNAHFNPQTETFSTIPAFKHLDRNEFEIILYAVNVNGNLLEQYCQSCADKLVQLPNSLPNQVQTIRADDLDIILIGTNVTAVTNDITLLAVHRLARVQVTCFSSPVTTGIRNIDYYISGTLTEPAQGAQNQYNEQLLTLDGTGYCFNYWIQPESSAKPTRQSLGIEDKSVVFISGANFYKIIPELRKTWAKIIALVPNSVLVLYPFSSSWSSFYAANSFASSMKTIFANYGIDKSRIIILDTLPNRSDVKEHLKLADVYLDSYPYSGSHSTLDSLEVGLPTIVMNGTSLRSRQAAALLRELQIPDLIADSEEPYIQLAIALGTNPELRKQKSDQIKQGMQANPRFLDSRSYSARMGTLFQELFRKHQAIALAENLNLRDINLIIFPDWNQAEDLLYQDLASVITSLVSHPDKNQMTLLIHKGNFSEDEANLFLSGVVMNLLLEEDLDVVDDPKLSFVGQMDEMQWEALLPRIQARIVLENENQEAIAKLPVEKLPQSNIASFQ